MSVKRRDLVKYFRKTVFIYSEKEGVTPSIRMIKKQFLLKDTIPSIASQQINFVSKQDFILNFNLSATSFSF